LAVVRAGSRWCDLVKHADGRVEFVHLHGTTVICEHADTGAVRWAVDAGQPLLYLRAAADRDGRVCVIGQGHQDGGAWVVIEGFAASVRVATTATPFPVLIMPTQGRTGWTLFVQVAADAYQRIVLTQSGEVLVRAGEPMSPTSQGFLFVDWSGTPVTQDAGRNVVPGLALPSPADAFVMAGQSTSAATIALWDIATNQITPLNTPGGQPPHIVESGGTYYVCSYVEGGAWLSMHRRPFASAPAEPVLDTTSVVDVLDYLPIGVALEGSHLYACRYTGQQPNVFSIAKHPDGGGEWWAHDDAWVYHHLDQAGSPINDVIFGQFNVRRDANGNRIDAYYFADDARWMPRRVKTGHTLTVETRIYRIADGSSEPWRHVNRFEVFSSYPSPIGTGRALVMTYDPRRHRDPNGRLQGRYEKGVYVVVHGRKYHRWEDWRTKDDNSGDELMQQTEFQQVDTAPAVTWRLSRRPANAKLLPDEDEMNAPGVTVDRYGSVIGPTGTWSVEFHDRNNVGISGKVEIVNGSVHVTMTNPEGSDRSGNRRPVEVRGV
jgi:hypothetical protein